MALSPYHWFTAYSQHQADLANPRRAKGLKPWGGPVAQAYILPEGVVVLDLTSAEDRYRIASLPLSEAIGSALQGSDGTWSGQHARPDAPLSNVYISGQFPSLEDVEVAIRTSVARLGEEAAVVAASPLLQLEGELKGKDWYSHFSDDYAHWSGGERSDRKIKSLIPRVDPADFVRLWNQYAPEGFACPVTLEV